MPFLKRSTNSTERDKRNKEIIDLLFSANINQVNFCLLQSREYPIEINQQTHQCNLHGKTMDNVKEILVDQLNNFELQLTEDAEDNRKDIYNFFRRLLECELCIENAKKPIKQQDTEKFSEKALYFRAEIEKTIRQQTEEKVFHDIDVCGDGNCYYNAVLMSLINLCLTDEAAVNSQIEKQLLAPNGLFDKIKENIRSIERYENFEFAEQRAAVRFIQLISLFKNKYFLLEQIMVPALRNIIADYYQANEASLNQNYELRRAVCNDTLLRVEGANNDGNRVQIAKNNSDIMRDNEQSEYLATRKAITNHFSKVRNNDNYREEGGEIESIILRQVYGIDIASYDQNAVDAPEVNKPTIFIRNLGRHFHFGLLRAKNNTQNDYQTVMNFNTATLHPSSSTPSKINVSPKKVSFQSISPTNSERASKSLEAYEEACQTAFSLIGVRKDSYPELAQIMSTFKKIPENSSDRLKCANEQKTPNYIYNNLIQAAEMNENTVFVAAVKALTPPPSPVQPRVEGSPVKQPAAPQALKKAPEQPKKPKSNAVLTYEQACKNAFDAIDTSLTDYAELLSKLRPGRMVMSQIEQFENPALQVIYTYLVRKATEKGNQIFLQQVTGLLNSMAKSPLSEAELLKRGEDFFAQISTSTQVFAPAPTPSVSALTKPVSKSAPTPTLIATPVSALTSKLSTKLRGEIEDQIKIYEKGSTLEKKKASFLGEILKAIGTASNGTTFRDVIRTVLKDEKWRKDDDVLHGKRTRALLEKLTALDPDQASVSNPRNRVVANGTNSGEAVGLVGSVLKLFS